MPVSQDAVGKQWPSASFEVEPAGIIKYAEVIGADHPVHHDAEAARAAGFRDLVAPPMFCVVYSGPAMGPAIMDPEVGMNLPAMVHGGQGFVWGEPVCAGDTISTTASCREIYEKDGKGFYVFETTSTNQQGEQTVKATWTTIVRGV